MEIVLRRDPVGDVVPGRDEPLDGGIVEQVGDRERERDRSARRVTEVNVDRDRRGRRARLDELDGTNRGVEHFVVALVDRVNERPVLEPLLVEPEDSGQAAGGGFDDALARQEHGDRSRVLHQRAEPRDLVAGDFPTPALGQVACAENEAVAQRGADHLDESPAVGTADPELEERPDLLGLNAREGEDCQLEVVGMDEVEAVLADCLVDGDAEEALGGAIGPTHLGHRVDHQDGVGERGRDRGEACVLVRGQFVRAGATLPVVNHRSCSSTPTPGRLRVRAEFRAQIPGPGALPNRA